MSDWINIVVGGVIAIVSSGATQLITHHLKTQADAREKEMAKLEEFVSTVYELDDWLGNKQARIVFGQDKPETGNPYPKLLAISIMYFPQFLPQVRALDMAAKQYEYWMLQRGQNRLNNETRKLSDGIKEAYAPFYQAKETLLSAIIDFAVHKYNADKEASLFSSK
jgi:hypothetical protein